VVSWERGQQHAVIRPVTCSNYRSNISRKKRKIKIFPYRKPTKYSVIMIPDPPALSGSLVLLGPGRATWVGAIKDSLKED
jgi:hypothetical protein